jgi:hypothetical protein
MAKRISQWETAILQVLGKNGSATLLELYRDVPPQILQTKTTDTKHEIRGFLRRLKNVKGKIKQIGLSKYALIDYVQTESMYENIQKQEFEKVFFTFPTEKIHDTVEGMLIEIGNLKGYETYTADNSAIFNNDILGNIATYKNLPEFTYSTILKTTKEIDVVWFKDGFPYATFDIENSTDYTKAFERALNLKYFKTKFYMVGHEKKENIFNERQNRISFNEIKNATTFYTIKNVFDDYKSLVLENKNRHNSLFYL